MPFKEIEVKFSPKIPHPFYFDRKDFVKDTTELEFNDNNYTRMKEKKIFSRVSQNVCQETTISSRM